jgi:hypothetical protein
VVAVFAQLTGPFVPGSERGLRKNPAPESRQPAASLARAAPDPTVWKIRAPLLTYWSDQGRAHLEGGVEASSDQGALSSRTLDVFLDSPGAGSSGGPLAVGSAAGGRQLDRVLAQGSVIVRQGDRRGMAEQAEFTAATQKFVLSGGQPTLVNAASDTTTGHSLTFFVANDTILIDSQEGSRTLTKHRVEK